ncbi:unnamed protein product, partial [marine sediment metagenome]
MSENGIRPIDESFLKKKQKPESGHSPVTIVYSENNIAKLVGDIRMCGSEIAEDPMRTELIFKPTSESGQIKVLVGGKQELNARKKMYIYPEIVKRPKLVPHKLK